MKKFVAIIMTLAMLMAMSAAVAAEFVSSPPAGGDKPTFPGFIITPWASFDQAPEGVDLEGLSDAAKELMNEKDLSKLVAGLDSGYVVREIYDITVDDDLKDKVFADGPRVVTIDAGLGKGTYKIIVRGDSGWMILNDLDINEDGSASFTINELGVYAIVVCPASDEAEDPKPPQTSDSMLMIIGVMAVAGVATVAVAKKRKA